MSRDISPPPAKRSRLSTLAPKAESVDTRLSIYSWNVNGVSPFVLQPITSFFANESRPNASSLHDGAESIESRPSLRDLLRRHAWPAVLCLQEVKINPDDAATQAAVEKAVQRRADEDPSSPSYTAHFCLSSDKHNARGIGRKVYGVCSIIREDFYEQSVATVRTIDWDREGRILLTETRATDAMPKLAIFNVYAVNGTDSPYKDPQTGQPSGTRHDRKRQVHALLQAECRKLEDDGFRCMIAGDINIARAAIDGHPNLRTFPKQHCVNRADFEARFIAGEETQEGEASVGLGMIDTFRHLHPEKRGYTYFPRRVKFGDSCDRVDMILTSKALQSYLAEAGMHETPADRGPSDHVPIYAKFDFEKLYGGEIAGEVRQVSSGSQR